MYSTKQEAKQLACQKLLKKLHPNTKTWNQLLDLYTQSYKFEDDRPTGPNFQLIKQIKEAMVNYMKTRDSNANYLLNRDKVYV